MAKKKTLSKYLIVDNDDYSIQCITEPITEAHLKKEISKFIYDNNLYDTEDCGGCGYIYDEGDDCQCDHCTEECSCHKNSMLDEYISVYKLSDEILFDCKPSDNPVYTIKFK